MINEGPSDIFITAYFLVPTTRSAAILKINPLTISPIQIQHTSSSGDTHASVDAKEDETLVRIGKFLVSQLRVEYKRKDEQTALTVTWLNSALRSSQKSSTIVGQVQIRQWALMDPERNKKPPQKPTVKFRGLDKALLDVDIDSHSRKRKRDDTQTSQGFVKDMDAASDNDGWLDEHDPEVEQDLLHKSSDTVRFTF
ncbi:hypothetical protein AZE42_12713 [Rhizopogon vesiculosus]|uniref:Uncharacterized protein n=1 Tax=Rhizopogon vesiculosus TaxID=180088 RepID=A0A1J8PRQ8_9AGAM|nr:hypothetical protein AZE42_12713 [Rhizopogon vesiculosus]